MSKLNVEVSDPVVVAARMYAVTKYGSSRGIGKIVEDALREYLEKREIPIDESVKIGERGNCEALSPVSALAAN